MVGVHGGSGQSSQYVVGRTRAPDGQRSQIDAVDTVSPVNYEQHNEAKLRARKQGIEESTLEYYYDVLDLRRRVDARMAEAMKIAYLWQGLRPSVLEKLWSLKPANCDEFLQEVKCFQEMTDRGNQDEWAMGVMGRKGRPRYGPSGKQDATVATRFEKIEKMYEELMQRKYNSNQGTNNNRARDPKATTNWTPDGSRGT
ncbi:hypothetical protein OUZ56_012418 [Daphnia magna]|uniref:Uncharacterized protein n=1 Tax=Daphnia magna TaxID=35525 RepID=A0ABQ9Z2X9_9CRUS|nr:hypothetical protein OUZ56_012418 [Daphnia magna]